MSTNVTFNGISYSIPASGELNWGSLSTFLIALGNYAQVTGFQKVGVRTATTSPVTLSSATDCVVVTTLAVPGAVAVTLPAGVTGQYFSVIDGTGDAATNNITITPAAGLINGAATYVVTKNKGAVTFCYTGSEWKVISEPVISNPLTTTGDILYSSGGSTAARLPSAAGVLHGGPATLPTYSTIVNADVDAGAAIVGSKLVAAASGVIGAVTATTQTFTGIKTFETSVKLASAGGTASELNYYEENTHVSTFTFDGSGGTSSSITIQVIRIGSLVTLAIPFVTATTGTNSAALNSNTVLLSRWRPIRNTTFTIPVMNNGAVVADGTGMMRITTAGLITFYRNNLDNFFTNSATAGFQDDLGSARCFAYTLT